MTDATANRKEHLEKLRDELFEQTCVKPKIPLWRHQREAVLRAKDRMSFALFFDPGTGKTATTINILRNKYAEHKGLFTTLVLCPPVVIENWKRELLAHSSIPEKSIVTLTGSGEERYKKILGAPEKAIFITNYEALLMPKVFAALLSRFKSNATATALVLDESHKCKESTAKRTKRAIDLSDLATYRYLLTGTPILNDMMDIFAQFRILDRGFSFGKNVYSFRARYFYDKNKNMPKATYFPDWRPLPGTEPEIQGKIQAASMLAKKEECVDLPPLVRESIIVDLSSEQKRLYKSMKEDLIATLMDEKGKLRASIAELAITKALRLQQIVSGHIRVESDEGPQTMRLKDNPRKDAVKQLLEDLAPAHKVIIWAVFKDNYADLREVCESLKLPFVEVHGEIKNKQAEVDAFNNDPAIRVLIGHPKSGGIGVNMVAASYSIFYTRSFSREDDVQAEARNYRAGSNIHEKVTRIDLVARGTIDEVILKALADKTELSANMLKERMDEI